MPRWRRRARRLRSQHKLSEHFSGSECVLLHFDHLGIGGRGGQKPGGTEHTRCQHPAIGLHVGYGRSVQSPEVGSPSRSSAVSALSALAARRFRQ